MCKVGGCGRSSRYIAQDVCQKHYFRMMRTGSYLLTGKKSKNGERKPFLDASGYVLIYKPKCPISRSCGLIFEHRFIMYGVYGDSMPPCELCGSLSSWDSRSSHVDHIDEVKHNNNRDNLRVLCNACNTGRTIKVEHKRKSNFGIEWNGEIKTAQEWGRDQRIPAKGHLIRQRLARGYTVEEAFFSKKLTHK